MIGLALGVEGSYLIVPFLATPQAGNFMVNAGLFDGDILVVDRAEQASHAHRRRCDRRRDDGEAPLLAKRPR